MATQIAPDKQVESPKKAPLVSGGSPFAGHLPEFTHDRLGLLLRMTREGEVMTLRFGPYLALLFNKPEHVQSILVEHAYDFDKTEIIHTIFRPVFGNGIFTSEGDFHRRQRKLVAPSFQPRQVASYAETMVRYSEQIQQGWSEGSVVDVNQKMTDLTMSIIGKVLFDAEVFTETGKLGGAMKTALEYVSFRMSQLFPPPYNWPLPLNRRTHKAVQLLRTHTQRFIDERRANPSERNDFLSILLQARDEDGQPMPDEQVMAECVVLFVAGHETTATALTWCWYLLCQHPAIYQRVQQEVDSVLQGRSPTFADLAQLPYCLQVFKEALRLYPPAYFTARRALHDLEIDGYRVRKNQLAILAPYTLHRRAEYFPDPETFDPERFTPEHEKQLPRHAYLPFGAGPRVCIGNHFSLMEGQLLLATLAQRVSFELVPDQSLIVDPIHHLTLRPSSTLNMTVKRR